MPPIHQAPADVLHHIFQLCILDNIFDVDDASHPAVVLSHVCQSWRELLLNHSPYWSGIRIFTPSTPMSEDDHALSQWQIEMQRLLNTARLFITRSDECPLTITVSTGYCLTIDSPHDDAQQALYSGMFSSLLQLLCSASQRWSKCCFDISPCSCVEPALKTITDLKAEDVPILTQLEWFGGADLEEGGIHSGSSLRSLDLPLHNHDAQPWSTMSVNWSTLTELIYLPRRGSVREGDPMLRYFGPRSALSLLRRCNSLVACHLSFDKQISTNQDYPEENLGSPIELKHLRSLTAVGYLPDGVLLDSLCLPSLRELQLFDMYGSSPSRMLPWVETFGKNLTSLFIVLNVIGLEDVKKLLGCVPGLHLLTTRMAWGYGSIDVRTIGLAFLNALTSPIYDAGEPTEMGLCPNLRQFNYLQDMDALFKTDLVRFAKERRPPLSGLRGAILFLDEEVEFARLDNEDIRALILEEGNSFSRD